MPDRWFGQVEVRTMPHFDSVLGDNIGAIVNVIAFCKSDDDFKQTVKHALGLYNLVVQEFTEVESLEPYLKSGAYLSDEIKACLKDLSLNNPVVFDEFQAFSEL